MQTLHTYTHITFTMAKLNQQLYIISDYNDAPALHFHHVIAEAELSPTQMGFMTLSNYDSSAAIMYNCYRHYYTSNNSPSLPIIIRHLLINLSNDLFLIAIILSTRQ